jgi:hypothetical protein
MTIQGAKIEHIYLKKPKLHTPKLNTCLLRENGIKISWQPREQLSTMFQIPN